MPNARTRPQRPTPRGDLERYLDGSDDVERANRIVRRGITYGERPDLEEGSTADRPSDGVGLLFMSFQANLGQFVIQQEGSDSNHFVRHAIGVDPVIGQNDDPVHQVWSKDGFLTFTMAGAVTMLGGEYFFAPGMAFLETMADTVAAAQ